MNQAELIEVIENAFTGVTRNGGVSLHETIAIDNYGTDEERQQARKKDRDRRWQDVSRQDLAEVCGIGGISFFDPIGWRYYLPAYMTWYLVEGYRSASFAADQIIFTFKLPTGIQNPLREHSLSRFQSLNLNQSKAVKTFLEYVVLRDQEEDAQQALDLYWHQF